ncbi:MAG: S-layer homology domain-containing protein [Chloroflexota bacterium]|nr:S-layer homology domain-containing protein [Chloroflexota bacterium]
MLARWIVRAQGWPIDLTGAPHFTDVPTADPLYLYVETAYNHGVFTGYADHTFRPTNPVTRGQMSKMVVNAMGWPFDTSPGPVFRDVDPSNPFWNQIETIYAHGLVSGYDCGPGCREFRWNNTTTRGQLTKVLSNAIAP